MKSRKNQLKANWNTEEAGTTGFLCAQPVCLVTGNGACVEGADKLTTLHLLLRGLAHFLCGRRRVSVWVLPESSSLRASLGRLPPASCRSPVSTGARFHNGSHQCNHCAYKRDGIWCWRKRTHGALHTLSEMSPGRALPIPPDRLSGIVKGATREHSGASRPSTLLLAAVFANTSLLCKVPNCINTSQWSSRVTLVRLC